LDYLTPPTKTKENIDRIEGYCDALVTLSELYDSPTIMYNLFLVWILRFEMFQEYETMLEICDQADKYIEKNPDFYQEEKLIIFHTKKMLAYLHLKDYQNGKINAEQCLNVAPEGSLTWFAFMEYYLLLAIHTEQYIQAIAIFNQATSNNKFIKLTSVNKEKCSLYEAFLNYIIHFVKGNNPIFQKQQRKRFSVNKFIEKPAIFPKEHRIFSILTLILQSLFLIEKRNLAAASEKIERLKNNANRQLKKDFHFRPIQFIRLLQQLKKANYQIDELRNTEKYIENLSKQPFAYRGALHELEIIPYNKLWELLYKRLER